MLPSTSPLWLKIILHPGALGLVGDEIELVPQPVELVLALFVQDQLHQRGVVAVIAAGIVIAGAEQAAIVGRLVGPVAAALADIEGVGENGGEAVERLLVLCLLSGRIDQVGIAITGIVPRSPPSAGEASSCSGGYFGTAGGAGSTSLSARMSAGSLLR